MRPRERRLKNMEAAWPPAERGFSTWLVVAASFLSTGLCLGIVNSFGVIYAELQERLATDGISERSSKAALVGSLTIGVLFAFSPFAGIISAKIGARKTALLGGIIAAIGVAASSFVTSTIELLYITYGIIFGLGASLAYIPSQLILVLYFEAEVNFVNGIVAIASATFTAILPHVLQIFIFSYGLEWTLKAIGVSLLFVVGSALTFGVPAENSLLIESNSSSTFAPNVSIWHNRKYLSWTFITVVALIGYFIPYVHLIKYASITFPDNDGTILIMCIGLSFGVGRTLYGHIADLINANRIFLQQLSLLVVGSCCLLFSQISDWYMAIVLSLVMGLFDGCFISQVAPIAVDLCGVEGAPQAVNCYFALCSIPIAAGPPLAGLLFDHTQSYFLPFTLAGAPLIFGGVALSFIKCC